MANLKVLFVFEFLLFFTIKLSALNADKPFMADFIERSIARQSDFLASLNIPADKPFNIAELNQAQIATIINHLESLSGSNRDNCWFYFFKGLLVRDINREENFNLSILNAQQDAGALWLLYIAFVENDISGYNEKILNLLEKQLLLNGAEQSSVISRQLLDYAGTKIRHRDYNKATDLFIQAQRFGSNDIYNIYTTAWKISPLFLFKIPDLLQSFYHSFFNSTVSHVAAINSAYRIVKLFFSLFVLSLVTIFLIKYLPYVLHRFVDYFPSSLPYYVRLAFVCIIFVSFISFGVLPFLWLSSILIFKHLSKNEKTLYNAVFVLLLLAPLDVHVQSLFVRATNPAGVLQVYSRSVREGYSESIQQSIISSLASDPENKLLNLAHVNYSLKTGDLLSAKKHLDAVQFLYPDDPVVLTTAGNLAFFQNNFDSAIKMYTKALEIAPTYSDALYNSGQCLLRKLQTVDAMEMIDKAVKYSSVRINNFMKVNDQYFTDTVPVLRRIVFADYTPSLFWSKLSFNSVYDQSFASAYWGMSFLGVPSWITLFISFAILISVWVHQFLSETKKPLRIFFECRYCGKLLCRACKNGSLCSSCSDALKFVHNEHVLEKLHNQITARSYLIRNTTHSFADMLFPGAGYILRGELFSFKTGFLIIVSSAIYVCYYLIMVKSAMFSHFHCLHLLILLPCLTYSFFFIIKYARLILKEATGYIRSLEV
ncbi:MAG TPA: tetratricopeptide repeat protein [Chitinispirillaceae bacterium]|nr:tetratricopeptide repeat protein [Chitinispirillaceae bacterium]